MKFENFQKYSVQLPSALLISFLGLIWGISCLHSNILAKATDYMLVNPEDMAYVYLPITTFSISFCLDIHIFLKTLPQILVIAIPGTVVFS
jgi:sodium/hydrogen exchanger 10/11